MWPPPSTTLLEPEGIGPMTLTLGSILLLLAFVCFVLAALNKSVKKVSLGWLGLAFWVLSLVLESFQIKLGP
jgi:hypothetical protein